MDYLSGRRYETAENRKRREAAEERARVAATDSQAAAFEEQAKRKQHKLHVDPKYIFGFNYTKRHIMTGSNSPRSSQIKWLRHSRPAPINSSTPIS